MESRGSLEDPIVNFCFRRFIGGSNRRTCFGGSNRSFFVDVTFDGEFWGFSELG